MGKPTSNMHADMYKMRLYFLLYIRENRYLLFITENYAALEILKQYIQDQKRKPFATVGIAQLSDDTIEETLPGNKEKPSSPLGSDSLLKGAHNTFHDSEEKLSPTSSSDALSEDTTYGPLHNHEETPPSPVSSEVPQATTGSTCWNYEEKESPPLGISETEYTREGTLQDDPIPVTGTATLSGEDDEGILQSQRDKLSPPPGSYELLQAPSKKLLETWEMEPFILFGSSFPKDKEYTQVSSSTIHLVSTFITSFFLRCLYYSNTQATYNYTKYRSAGTLTKLRFAWRQEELLS